MNFINFFHPELFKKGFQIQRAYFDLGVNVNQNFYTFDCSSDDWWKGIGAFRIISLTIEGDEIAVRGEGVVIGVETYKRALVGFGWIFDDSFAVVDGNSLANWVHRFEGSHDETCQKCKDGKGQEHSSTFFTIVSIFVSDPVENINE